MKAALELLLIVFGAALLGILTDTIIRSASEVPPIASCSLETEQLAAAKRENADLHAEISQLWKLIRDSQTACNAALERIDARLHDTFDAPSKTPNQ